MESTVRQPVARDAPLAPSTGAAQIAAQVRSLHAVRLALAAAAETIAEHEERLRQQEAELYARREQLHGDVESAESALRALVLAHHRLTGEPKPAAGVEVRLFAVLRYEAAAALAWAKETRLALLPESLDRKAFEKIAKATTLPFVATDHEPRVMIATDLATVLGGAA